MVSQLRASLPLSAPDPVARAKAHPWLHAVEGTVQVFTSPHRSFFTNVMVQAMRVAGQGHAVLIAQFLKGGIRQGVDQSMQFGQGLEWMRPDIQRAIASDETTEGERDAIVHLWQHAETMARQGRYSLVVLDELSLAIRFGLIAEADVLTFLQQRPSQVDVIMTGPEMPASLLAIADQVTEFRRHFMP
ncbi:MAG: cob(I)yrinic acid a,c-diamide adenosyltransferase [Cyanobacteria bacterium P01_D01_bin.115]